MRLALVARQLGMGGAERQLYLLATNLAADRVAVHVVSLGATADEFWAGRLREAGLPVTHVRARTVSGRLLATHRLLLRLRPDVVHTMHFAAGGYGILGRPGRVPVVVGLRELPHMGAVPPSTWQRISLRGASVIVCNSSAACDLLRRRFPSAARSVVIPNAVQLAPHAPRGAADSGLTIGLVARLVAEKRVDRFVRCVAALKDHYPALRAEIVGDGPERIALEALSRELGVDRVLSFVGERPALATLTRFDVLCLTSDVESMPNVLLEAAAAGVPVVATRVGGVPEVVADGQTGCLVDVSDDVAYRKCVSSLLADPSRRAAMGRAARAVVEHLYSPTAMALAYEQLYQSLLAHRLSGAPNGVSAT